MKSILIKLINIIISPKLQPVLTAKMLFYASLETEKWETLLRLNQSKWFCNFSCQLVQIPSKNLILAEKSFNKRNTRILKIIWLFKIVFVYTYKPVNLKGNQPWILIRRTDAEAEAPIFWPPYVKSQLIRKILMLVKTEGRRRRGQQRTKLFDGITDWVDEDLSKLLEMVKDRETWFAAVHGVTKSWT